MSPAPDCAVLAWSNDQCLPPRNDKHKHQQTRGHDDSCGPKEPCMMYRLLDGGSTWVPTGKYDWTIRERQLRQVILTTLLLFYCYTCCTSLVTGQSVCVHVLCTLALQNWLEPNVRPSIADVAATTPIRHCCYDVIVLCIVMFTERYRTYIRTMICTDVTCHFNTY